MGVACCSPGKKEKVHGNQVWRRTVGLLVFVAMLRGPSPIGLMQIRGAAKFFLDGLLSFSRDGILWGARTTLVRRPNAMMPGIFWIRHESYAVCLPRLQPRFHPHPQNPACTAESVRTKNQLRGSNMSTGPGTTSLKVPRRPLL